MTCAQTIAAWMAHYDYDNELSHADGLIVKTALQSILGRLTCLQHSTALRALAGSAPCQSPGSTEDPSPHVVAGVRDDVGSWT